MKRKNLSAFIFGLLLGASLVALYHGRAAAGTQAENRPIETRLAELEQPARSSAPPESGRALEKPSPELLELMRLRNEVTQLRNARDAASQALAENERLRGELNSLGTALAQSRGQLAAETRRADAGEQRLPQLNTSDTAQQAHPSNPAFYMRDHPELMRRYFPHLVTQESDLPSEDQ